MALAVSAGVWFFFFPDVLIVDKYGGDKNRLENVYKISMKTWKLIARVLSFGFVAFILYGNKDLWVDLANLVNHNPNAFEMINGTVAGDTPMGTMSAARYQDIFLKEKPGVTYTFHSGMGVDIGCEYQFLVLRNSHIVVQFKKVNPGRPPGS